MTWGGRLGWGHPPRRVATALAVACWALAGGPPPARADEPVKPHVVVAFEVQAPTFRANLGPQQRASAEEELARSLADELARRYGFAEWRLPAPAAAASGAVAAPIGSLIARLVETPAQPGPRVEVRWFGGFGAAAPAALALQPIEVYAPSNPNWHSNNRNAFVSHVKGKLMGTVQPDGFMRVELRRELVRRLPIATAVEARADEQVIVIPRLWKHLQLGRQSVLFVQFSRGSGAQQERGELKLMLPSQRPRGPFQGWVQAGVREASFGPRTLALTGGWNAELPALLGGGASLACFIDDYQPPEFDGTLGAVALTPD